MVLHHVAERARGLVVAGAPLEAERFRHRDLHMIDMGSVPDRLEQSVGKAQRHQVLHRLLAEIVVDAEDLALGEHLADGIVDGPRAGSVLADRLFDDDAAALARQAMAAKPLGQRREEVGADGEIEGADAAIGRSEEFRQRRPAGLARGVDGDISEPAEEALQYGGIAIVLAHMLGDGRLDERLEVLGGKLPPRGRDDPRILW